MKRISTLLAVISLLVSPLLSAQTQFANNGFENWQNSSSIPNNWNTFQINLGFINYTLCDISKSSLHNSGNFSVQLKPKKLSSAEQNALNNYLQGYNLDNILIPAFLTNAQINISLSNISDLAGLLTSLSDFDLSNIANNPLIERLNNLLSDGLILPANNTAVSSVSGYYRFAPASENESIILAVLTVNTSNSARQVSGGGVFTARQATDGFTEFNIDVNTFGRADELVFMAFAVNMGTNTSQTGTLNLDDITVNYGQLSIDSYSDKNNQTVYPNPTKNHTCKLAVDSPVDIEIYDVSGNKISDIPNYTPNSGIYLPQSGVYLIKYDGKQQKVVVQ